MAVIIDWKLVTQKEIKKLKKKKPVKKNSFSFEWQNVYWIEKPSLHLWEWKVISINKWVARIDALLRNIRVNPNKERSIQYINIKELTLNK